MYFISLLDSALRLFSYSAATDCHGQCSTVLPTAFPLTRSAGCSMQLTWTAGWESDNVEILDILKPREKMGLISGSFLLKRSKNIYEKLAH